MHKFWNFIRDEDGERILRLEGPIDEDSFWGDEVTPDAFRDELEAEEGDVTVWINSPGGNVFAAAQIYTMLRDHKGKITVKIDAIAASAASVVAMAGDRVLMSPVAMLMIHDPMTIAMGNAAAMEKAIEVLNEVKKSIINAYVTKTGLSQNKIAKLMSDETWMNAKKAVDLGFADEILFKNDKPQEPDKEEEKDDEPEKEVTAEMLYSTKIMGQKILNRYVPSDEDAAGEDEDAAGTEKNAEDTEPGEERAEDAAKTDSPEDLTVSETEEVPEPAPETETVTVEESPPEPVENMEPAIGMDGKTEDGAMPYELLMKQLEFLR